MATGEETAQGFWSGIARIRDVSFVLAIYLFFTGFIYRYYYLTSFGISPKFDDSALYTVLVYAYSAMDFAFQQSPFARQAVYAPLIMFAVDILVLDLIFRNTSVRYPLVRDRIGTEIGRLALPIGVATAIILFPLLFNAARAAGVSDAVSSRAAAQLGLDFKLTAKLKDEAAKSYDAYIRAALSSPSLRIVSQDDESYYLLYQPPFDLMAGPTRGMIYVVRKGDIESMSIVLPGSD